MRRRAAVIGSGLGGLAVALRLSVRGWDVTVLEQGPAIGGKMNTWSEEGFRFDTGPSLITMPWVFADLFRLAGEPLEDHLVPVRLHPLAEYVYADGTRLTYSTSLPDWMETVRSIEPRDVDGFFRYMKLGAKIYELSRETFLRQMPREKPDLRVIKALRYLPLRKGWGNYHRTVTSHFHSTYLRQLFDRYPTYVGSSPYSAPATLTIIPYIEYAFGGWYVQGGLYRIIESIKELLGKYGVTILTGTRVVSIDHRERRVGGVGLSDGTRIPADVVIMNGDPSMTPSLLGDTQSRDLPLTERSLSGVVFLVGISRPLPQFGHHTVYFSDDYAREFHELFVERRFPDDPTVYVNIASRTDRTMVPGGGECLFIMANAPADDALGGEEQINNIRSKVFGRLRKSGFPDIEADIVVSDVWTPARIASRYLMPGGVIYGTHSHGWRHAFLRPPNIDRSYRGLYYVGGGTHPGGGTPTVLLSAEITSRLIREYEGL